MSRTPIRRRINFTADCHKLTGEPRQPVMCDLHITDPTLFVEHMTKTHGIKSFPRTPQWVTAARRPWKVRRLRKDPEPFAPTGFEPGATVTWKQLVPTGETRTEERNPRPGTAAGSRSSGPVREWVERSGQVWSLGSAPKSAWVIPYQRFAGEHAVLVQESYGGTLREHSTWGDDNAATFKANTNRRMG